MKHGYATVGVVAALVLAAAGAHVLVPGAHPAPRSAAQPAESPDGTAGESALAASGAAPPTPDPANVTTFASADDFAAYLRAAGLPREGGAGRAVRDAPREAVTATPTPMATGTPAPDGGDSAAEPDRHSDTNVQVEGVDEPDLVKTDGQRIYYSPRDGRERGVEHDGHDEHDADEGSTRVIDAVPPGTAEAVAEIDHGGRMFLAGDRLVVLGESVWGYDVSDPSEPELVWNRSLDAPVRSARLHGGTMYLVLASPIDRSSPCPVEPMGSVNVSCTDVYHPDRPVPVSVTYTTVALDPDTGTVDDTLSAVGARDATVYASGDGLYLTYTERTSRASVRMNVLLGEARPLLPDRVAAHLRAVRGYNISDRATAAEIERTIDRWLAGVDEERSHEIREELHERTETYVREHRRELTTTHVVRIETNSGVGTGAAALSVSDTGAVPGRPLNQFSIDAHEGSVRIATTVGERWGTESVNDVYVLDADSLEVTGSVTGMGETERIYSVRFVGDRGYVVTFRRIDPFHVLDLSNASDPSLEGELKLPGYSSYLHPLPGDRVLGIGEEDGEVKAVIFDVSDPTDPTIAASRTLEADWSAIARTHHAFLLDRKHGVFFLPTEEGGMVLSSRTLETVHEVEIDDPQRALYIDDYLYAFGADELAVIDETEWERVETLEL